MEIFTRKAEESDVSICRLVGAGLVVIQYYTT
jgi:hypothetical protein